MAGQTTGCPHASRRRHGHCERSGEVLLLETPLRDVSTTFYCQDFVLISPWTHAWGPRAAGPGHASRFKTVQILERPRMRPFETPLTGVAKLRELSPGPLR